MQNQVDTTRDYAEDFISKVVDWLPELLGALLILFIGYLVAKALESLTRSALHKAKLNEFIYRGKGGSLIQRAIPSPSHFVASVVFWLLFLFTVSMAVSVLGIPALTTIVEGIYSYIPNLIAAVLIFLAASGLSAAAVTLVTNTMGETPTGKVVATAAPILIMGLATFMILNQLNIAPEIVTITYAALIGSAALGMALAFGLGGREVAGQILQNLYDASQRNKEVIKADVRRGAATAKKRKQEIQDR